MLRATIERFRGFDRRLWVLAVGWMLNAVGFSMAFPFLAVYLHKIRGFPMEQVALIYPVIGAARVGGVMASGILVDRAGRRRVMVGAPAAGGLIYLVLAWRIHLDAGLGEIAALLTAGSLAGAFFHAAADTYVADLVGPERRSDAYAVLRVGLNIGWMTGPALGAFLTRTPFSLLFAVTAASAFALSALGWLFCRETMDAAPASGAGRAGGALRSLAVFAECPSFLAFSLFAMLLFIGSSQMVSTMSVYTTSIVGISQDQLGALYVLNGLYVTLFQMPLNAALARVSLRTRMAAGALFYALGYGMLGAAHGFGGAVASITVVSLAEMLVMPSGLAITARYAPPEARGRFVGLFSMMQGIGFGLGPFIGCSLYGLLKGNERLIWALVPLASVAAGVGLFAMSHPALTGRPEEGGRNEAKEP